MRGQLANVPPSRSNVLYGLVVAHDIYTVVRTQRCVINLLTQSWNCFVGRKPDMVL